MTLRQTAREIFLKTLHAVRLSEVMRVRVHCTAGRLHVGDLAYPLDRFERVVVISIGKAAAPMSDAMVATIEPELRAGQTIEGVVVGATEPERAGGAIRFFRGSHPFPEPVAREAAQVLLALLEGCDERTLVLFQISGGASAMVEWALDPAMTQADEAEFHRALVRSGLPITQMNVLRKHFSRVKGGRLAVAARRATQCTLLISDVPEAMLDVIGSGPSLPDASTVTGCRRILAKAGGSVQFSPKVRAYFEEASLAETPKPGDPAFARAAWTSVLSSEDLCEQAQALAEAAGFYCVVDNGCDDWDYSAAAGYLMARVNDLRRSHQRVCVISAGEVLVEIPAMHGKGGRNQQFVLECARRIAQEGLSMTVLSAGSDGGDGNSPAAGGVVDETSAGRAGVGGVEHALATFDAYPLLERLGDAIVTGPTGNNVRDLRLLLSEG